MEKNIKPMSLEENKLSYKEYFKVAIPFMLSTLTQPIVGIVDTAVVGQLSNSTFIGGVSIGVAMFNTLYWILGFLRVSTTSYSTQSMGAQNREDKLKAFVQPFVIAIIIGVIVVLLQKPIWSSYMKIIAPEELVKTQAYIYYSSIIWGAPIVLSTYVILGWLMGQTKVKEVVIMQVGGNIINIILDIVLVKVFNLKVQGVAMATLLSQIFTLLLGLLFMVRCSGFKIKEILNKNLYTKKEISNKLFVNTDFVIRTVCLLIVNNIFTATSSQFGAVILASNTIILQLESIISYLFEGLASAISVFSGRAIGNKNYDLYKDTIKITFKCTLMLIIVLTMIYGVLGENIIYLFTNIEEVILCVKKYDFWIMGYPLLAGFGLVFYGVFTGAMETKAIRNSTLLSMILFIITHKLLVGTFSNHGLWMSFLIYYLGRTVFLLSNLKNLNRRVRDMSI